MVPRTPDQSFTHSRRYIIMGPVFQSVKRVSTMGEPRGKLGSIGLGTSIYPHRGQRKTANVMSVFEMFSFASKLSLFTPRNQKHS